MTDQNEDVNEQMEAADDAPVNAVISFMPSNFRAEKTASFHRAQLENHFSNAFLKATANHHASHHASDMITGYGPDVFGFRTNFEKQLKAHNSKLNIDWIPASQTARLRDKGVIHLPDANLGKMARLRLRSSPLDFSITGVTSALSSHDAMQHITDLISAPIMPWDALICTSDAAGQAVKNMLTAQHDYLKWRFGMPNLALIMPQLPIIPPAINCDEFHFSDQQKQKARNALALEKDEITLLMIEQQYLYQKAHPHMLYLALEDVSKETGRKITLIQAGKFNQPAAQKAFQAAAKSYAPSIRSLFIDIKKPESKNQLLAAANIFISLHDNITETIDLAPLEAMAAGLPILVSDWGGYRAICPQAQAGYRVATYAPPANSGHALANSYEIGFDSHDRYGKCASLLTAADIDDLKGFLKMLVEDEAKRTILGKNAQAHVQKNFDWAHIYPQYQSLWSQLNKMRALAAKDAAMVAIMEKAPNAMADRQDPFMIFDQYPTIQFQPTTLCIWREKIDKNPKLLKAAYGKILNSPLFNAGKRILPTINDTVQIAACFDKDETIPLSIQTLSEQTEIPLDRCLQYIGFYLKLGWVKIQEEEADQAADHDPTERENDES